MSFVPREIDRLNGAINSGVGDRSELYAAQQALSWAIEPSGIQSPYAMIIRSGEAPEGCSALHHPPRS